MSNLTIRDKIMLGGLLAWLLLGITVVAFGHETQILNCGGYSRAVKVDEEVLPNGLLIERYDTNQDGKPDVNTYSVITNTDDKTVQHQAFPTFYVIDREPPDGDADYIMIDKNGDGFCTSIVLYVENPQDKDLPEKEVGL